MYDITILVKYGIAFSSGEGNAVSVDSHLERAVSGICLSSVRHLYSEKSLAFYAIIICISCFLHYALSKDRGQRCYPDTCTYLSEYRLGITVVIGLSPLKLLVK